MHTSAFRRLAGVTQVADAREGKEYHNRLTHTLKVAQISRRIAEKLCREQPAVVAEIGGVDPEVAEVAALAHDLGHPPFGHVAEKALDELLKENGVQEGYEGNAQSFRIITKLSIRRVNHDGLNLTRASLNAVLKYPWPRQVSGFQSNKWGFYPSEAEIFKWVRETEQNHSKRRSPEAEIMNWADDIAYSIHDLEDFYRAGLIPLDRLINNRDLRADFCESVFKRWSKDQPDIKFDRNEFEEAFESIINLFPGVEPYRGTIKQRAAIRNATSNLINDYASSISLKVPEKDDSDDPYINIEDRPRKEIKMLKELTREYVIFNSALATQQHGKSRIIKELFEIYSGAISGDGNWQVEIFPRDL